MTELAFRNRQPQPINLAFLRRIVRTLLRDLLEVRAWSLCIHLIPGVEMARLNERFLHHIGSTDVLTFDYEEPDRLAGEVFISIDDTLEQARRYRAGWQDELIRYIIHGVLHLQGYDDTRAAGRRRMKSREDSLLEELQAQFRLEDLVWSPAFRRRAACKLGGPKKVQHAQNRGRPTG